VFVVLCIQHAMRKRRIILSSVACEKRLFALSCLSVCPCVWNNSAVTGRNFMKFDIWGIFRNSVEEIQVSLKSEKNNGYFTWRSMYMYDHISLNSSQNKKCFSQNYGENQNTHFVFSKFFFVSLIFFFFFWDNVEKYCRSGQTTDDNMAHAPCTLDT